MLIALVGIGLTSCQEGPKVAKIGQPVEVGGIEVNVKGYDIRRLELVEGNRTHEYDKPVLAITVQFTNTGKEGFRYTPSHDSQQMTESTTPLLYGDPGKGKALPPKDKSPITGVVLEKGTLSEQISQSTMIKPGKSITDVMLFQVPAEKKADLIFSVPPSMHRDSKPVLFRVPYAYEKPKGPAWHGLGQSADLGGVKFKVSKVETTYVKTEHTSDGEGFSSSPLLKVTYAITNDSKEEITYNPGHHSVAGRRGAAVRAGDDEFARVRFSSNTKVVGQVTDSKSIKPGKALTDFSLFERPGKDVKVLKFEYPASRFGRGGLVRFNLPYKYEEPEKPEALKKDEDEEDEE